MSENKEIVDKISEKDEVIGTMTRDEVISKNLLHRGVIILVFNAGGDLYVQKRSQSKKICPGKYDVSAGGAVLSGEAYEDAANREFEEELGITAPLVFVRKIKYKDDCTNYIGHVYCIMYEDEIKPNPDEIESGKFISESDLARMMDDDDFSKEAKKIVEMCFDEAKELALS